MNFAQALGIFLSFYADRERTTAGERAQVQFPGTAASYNARHTEIGQRTLGRAHIFASGLIDEPSGAVYNVGDSPLTTGATWKEKWSQVCDYFGLRGVGPEKAGAEKLSVSAYMAQHRADWEEFEKKHGLRPGTVEGSSWEFLEVLLSLAAFDRQYDLSKFAETGFREREDIVQNYVDAFELMKAARFIP